MTDRIDTAVERAKLAALEGHTPGPWRKHGNGRHVTSDTDLVALAVAGPIKHNTRLIAATPDLKDTLAIALDEIDRLREALSRIERWLPAGSSLLYGRDQLWRDAYQETNPMRTADMHSEKCGCLRCEIDRLDHVSGESR